MPRSPRRAGQERLLAKGFVSRFAPALRRQFALPKVVMTGLSRSERAGQSKRSARNERPSRVTGPKKRKLPVPLVHQEGRGGPNSPWAPRPDSKPGRRETAV